MQTDAEGVLRFVSGAVLFPQRWSLIEKLGAPRPLAQLGPCQQRQPKLHGLRAACADGPAMLCALCTVPAAARHELHLLPRCAWPPDARAWAGMDMHRIHEPVPLYANEIQRPVDGFMSRLNTRQPFTRANWTVRCSACAASLQLACSLPLRASWRPAGTASTRHGLPARHSPAARLGRPACTAGL